ncbi:DNA polymerase III subunit gamma/tau [Anaerolineales bacterium HSG25]|nr:DNA polymerase III subunit gamma/tau [Anaerolineales bacterium HSG25]
MDGKLQTVVSQGEMNKMASQALYRKWRSQTFNDLIGQRHVTETLINALRLGRIGHAYLFTGPRGTGKTSMARLLAKAVNCLADDLAQRPCNQCTICQAITEGRLMDLIEIDAASNTGVDDIRDLRDKVSFRPSEARIKLYIIDEVHMLSNSAFNALLKTLEEPPGHVIFVLATTEPEKIPATITSRCQRFDFKRISVQDVAGRLAFILEQEGLSAESNALEYVARQGGGSMRDAISLLDQLTAYGGETITIERVQGVLGVVASETVMDLIDALLKRDVAQGLDIINQVVNDGGDPRQFGREIVEYLRSVMLVRLGGATTNLNMPDDVLKRITAQAHQANPAHLVQATKLFNQAVFELRSGLLAIPHLPLELAFVEATTELTTAPVAVQPVAVAQTQQVVQQTAAQPQQEQVPQKEAVPTGAEAIPDKPPEFDVAAVKGCFEQVVQTLERKSKLMSEVLRNNAQLFKIAGNEIYFVVDGSWKTRFEKAQPQAALNDVFSNALRRKVSIKFLAKEGFAQSSKTGQGPQILVDEARKLAAG